MDKRLLLKLSSALAAALCVAVGAASPVHAGGTAGRYVSGDGGSAAAAAPRPPDARTSTSFGPSAPDVPNGRASAGRGPGGRLAAGDTLASALPTGYTINGIDVSSHDHSGGKTVDWNAQRAAGDEFAFVKATEGTGYVNSYYGQDYQGAKNAGLYAGAYAFARPDLGDPVGQANFFVDHIQWATDGRTLPPFLDLEWPYSELGLPTCYGLSTGQMTSWISSFLSQVESRIGQTPMIYTNVNWWNPCTGNSSAFARYPLDISSCLGSPPSAPGWGSHWTFWQYDIPDCGRGGTRDSNVFNGSLTDLARLAGNSGEAAASAVYNPVNHAMEVYFNSRGNLAEKYWTSSGSWSDTVTLAGGLTGSPKPVANPMNQAMEVYFNSGGNLTEKYWTAGGSWSDALTWASGVIGSPSVVYNPAAQAIEVYYNAGGTLTEHYWNSTGWHGPINLSAAISGSPVAVVNPKNKALEVYFNSGGNLAEKYWTADSSWSDTLTWASGVIGAPSVVYNPAGDSMEVYYNAGGTLTEHYWNSTGWHGPINLGTAISGSPVALANPMSKALEVYFNSGGNLTEKYWTASGSWSDALTWASGVIGAPTAVHNPAASAIEVYYNLGGTLTEHYWNATGWHGPVNLGAPIS